MLALVLMLQANVADHSVEKVDFDLRTLPATGQFDEAIVVTGRRRDYLGSAGAQDRAPEPLLPRAETGLIGKSRIGVEVRQQGIGGGAVSNRAMIAVKMPF